MAPSLSFLTSFLPALPSLPFPSLPQNIQRRLLSFLLRKSVGRFIKGGLDADAVEADLARGSVSVQGLELADEAITPLLDGLPLSFDFGTIGLVAAQVSWPLSLSSALSVEVDDITLVLRVAPPTSLSDSTSTLANSTFTTTSSHVPASTIGDTDDAYSVVAESLISVAVASEFVKEELSSLEDAELRESLHLSESSIGDLPVPGAFGAVPRPSFDRRISDEDEVAEVTMLAGLIERILARLTVKVRGITLRLVMDDEESEDGLGGSTEVEVRIDEIVYADEKGGEEVVGGIKVDQEKVATIRSLKIAPPQILLRTPTSPPSTPRRSSSDSSDTVASADSTSSEEDDISPDHDMMMSQSIADLRTSFVSAASSGGASLYASARGGMGSLSTSGMGSIAEGAHSSGGNSSSEDESPFLDPEVEIEPRTAQSKRDSEGGSSSADGDDGDDGFRLVLSCGQESIFVVMSTPKPISDSSPPPVDGNSSPLPPPLRRRPPELNVQSSVPGPISLFLLPRQVDAILHLATALSTPTSPASPAPPVAPPRSTSASALTVAVNLKAVNVVLVYDSVAPSPTSLDLAAFWSHPKTFTLPQDHVRLRLEGLGAWIVRGPNEPSQTAFPLRSFSLTESTSLAGEVRSLPILIADANLAKQYEMGGSQTSFPSFESFDWMENRSAEGRGWKVKVKARQQRGSTGGRAEASQQPPKSSASATLTLDEGRTTLQLLPIHVFFDLTLLERILPYLTSIAAALPPSRSVPPNLPSAPSTPHARTPRPATPLSPHRILDDLAFEPIRGPEPVSTFELQCEMLRVEIRCPPPRKRKAEATGKVRSGIVILDMHEIKIALVQGVDGNKEATKITWDAAFLCFLPSQALQATSFLVISALPLDPSDELTVLSTPPNVIIRQLPAVDLSSSRDSLRSPPPTSTTTSIDCRLPLLRSSLDKRTLDGLQLFADDVAQWSERTLGGANAVGASDESDSERTENPKMIGSRYFGAKSFRRTGSDSSESSGDGASAVTFAMGVTDVVLDLFLSRGLQSEPTSPRHLHGLASDLELSVDLLRNSKHDLRAEVIVGDIELKDVSAAPIVSILTRTLPRNLTVASPPLIKVAITSSVEKETGLKESKIQLAFSNFTYYLTADLDWLKELSAFAKAPAGAFETVVPNELTRVRLRIADGSIHITPPTLDSHLVVSLTEARLSTNLMPDMPRTLATVELAGVRAFAVDSEGDLNEGNASSRTGCEFWRSSGFVQILDLERSSIQARQGNGLIYPDFELLVNDTKLQLAVCADTMASVGALATDLLNSESFKRSATASSPSTARRLPTHKKSADLLASVDPAAFHSAPSFPEMPEILDDDVPSNFDYLADALQQGSTTPTLGRPHAQLDTQGQIISDIDGETIRMLDPRGLQIIDGFLSEPRADSGQVAGSLASIIRCRLTNLNVEVHIHEGYDWFATRKAIEEEAKAVRRRLEKIRQLLASGQAPDASADEASVLMFGSVQLGLPPGASELPRNQLLAAINEELDDGQTDAESTVSSWQTLAGQAGQQPTPRQAALVGKARKRLTRSKAFAIQVKLSGVSAAFDTHPSASQVASKIRADLDSFEIVDNVRTSTWKKFLTELRPSDGGVVRSSGASMVRFELSKLRSAERPSSGQEEIAMKIKINPLRLYIDQDALDFLKAFGAFKLPSAGAAAPTAQPDTPVVEPFFQRVEILPVKIKLDYKPKRVDYHALRQGKTAELMNFFHFDGSEMTLRHLVVTGISGSTRLSELVQDIWTPDVKANQLADVISGIAPVRSVVNVGSGVANLVLLPIEQYRKDGRIVRGLQKGASAFAKQTTLEALNVGARLATGTQVILEQAEAVLGARPAASSTSEAPPTATAPLDSSQMITMLSEEERHELISRYAEQPGDLREGMESAYRSLGDNFRSAAQTILAVPMEVYERSGNEGPVRAVVRAVPIAVLKPMIGASEAVSKALFGLRNSLDPDAQAEAADKYKQASSSQ